jgi:hypothetical protein
MESAPACRRIGLTHQQAGSSAQLKGNRGDVNGGVRSIFLGFVKTENGIEKGKQKKKIESSLVEM